jgi:molecular chaperone DnaK
LIREDLKSSAEARHKELLAALENQEMSLDEIKAKLETFKQSVLAVGSDLYNRANQGVDEEFETVEEQVVFADNLAPADGDSETNTNDVESDFSFTFDEDEDETVAADYEPVD